MNIKKKLYLNAILPVVLVALIGAVLVAGARMAAEVKQQGRNTADTLTDILELTILADEYLLNHADRARQLWQTKHDLIGQELTRLHVRDAAERATLERMHRGVRETFDRIDATHRQRVEHRELLSVAEQKRAELTVAVQGKSRSPLLASLQEATAEVNRLEQEAGTLRERYANLVGELRSRSQAMVLDGLQLARRSQEQVADTERRAAYAIFGFVLLMGFVIAMTSLLISRSVVRPIARMKQGTEIVARGNLDFRLGIDTRDEIGELARTFDQMLDNLSRTTASRDELNRANEELKNSTTALIQSEKMASMGQMVAGVAHEINTPLAYVRSNVEIVKDHMDETKRLMDAYRDLAEALTGDDEQRIGTTFNVVTELAAKFQNSHSLEDAKDLLARGLNGLDQIRELVVNLKNFSRLDRDRVAGFNLNEGIDNVILLAKPVLKTRVKVVKEYGEIPFVVCSPSQINQVFLNVITNAAQAIESDKGGVITVKTAAVGGNVQVTIRDNGKGIAPEVLPKIFEPFFTTKKVGEGTGLGLSISRKIVEEHGGDIQVQSAVGKGSSITITLPAEGAMELRKSA